MLASKINPATRNRTRDHLIAAGVYSQMLYQLSYSRLSVMSVRCFLGKAQKPAGLARIRTPHIQNPRVRHAPLMPSPKIEVKMTAVGFEPTPLRTGA